MYKTVEREWGSYQILDKGPGSLTKLLKFNGKKPTSTQRHQNRAENWMCIKGKITIELEGETEWLFPGDFIQIRANTWHQATGEDGACAIEVWLGNNLSEDDIERK